MNRQETVDAPLHAPDSEAVVAAVRSARESGIPLMDYGRLHTGLGRAAPSPHTRLVRTGEVLEHDEADMVVRASAGCTMGQLQARLSEAGQWLPMDADEDVTLGEVVDHNMYGPLRVGYGAMRDQLLGLEFVDGYGELNRVGGRTVKNVAGYDVTKLLVGALGELGAVTEVTLRTRTVPPNALIVDLEVEDATVVDELLPTWLQTDAAPTWLFLSYEQGRFVMRAGYHGTTLMGHWQLRSLETLLDEVGTVHLSSSAEYDWTGDDQQRGAHRAWRRDCPAVAKLIVPPVTTGFVCQSLATASTAGHPREIEALPVHGCVYVGGEMRAAEARRLDEQIAHVIQPVGGMRVWQARPAGATELEPYWPEPTDYGLMRRLKQAMDPEGVLNPGRFLR